MRIDPKLIPVTTLEPREKKASATRTSGGGSASVVTLSSAGATASAATPPEMSAKLAHIRAQLEKGDYPVDLDKLASRIVDDEVLREGGK